MGCRMILALLLASLVASAQAGDNDPRGFRVRVTLSADARAALERSGEGVTVASYWYGTPKRSHRGRADEAGQIRAATRTDNVAGVDMALHLLPGKASSPAWGWIDGPLQANVNVYSSRKRFADNILSCDFIDGEVRALRSATTVIHCALITEQRPTRHFPG